MPARHIVMEVPLLTDLSEFTLAVSSYRYEGEIVTLEAWSNDGDAVTLTWDELQRSATVVWLDGSDQNDQRVRIDRETVEKISVNESKGTITFKIWTSSEELAGLLTVSIGSRVHISDAILVT